MNKRTPEQWRTLFAEHQASGLTQAQFCQQKGLCAKYFGLRRKQLMGINPTGLHSSPLIKVESPSLISSHAVSIFHQGVEVRLPQADANFVATLVKQLL